MNSVFKNGVNSLIPPDLLLKEPFYYQLITPIYGIPFSLHLYDNLNGAGAVQYSVYDNGTYTLRVYLSVDSSWRTCTHEAVHFVKYVFDIVGAPFDGDEPTAYFVDYMASVFNDYLSDAKKQYSVYKKEHDAMLKSERLAARAAKLAAKLNAEDDSSEIASMNHEVLDELIDS